MKFFLSIFVSFCLLVAIFLPLCLALFPPVKNPCPSVVKSRPLRLCPALPALRSLRLNSGFCNCLSDLGFGEAMPSVVLANCARERP
jgi:hypothetical protein